MDHGAPSEEKLQILKKLEDIGNRDFDGVDVSPLLRKYLRESDPEIILGALQASSTYASDEILFTEIFMMAQSHGDEEIRAMANSCLGAIIQDGMDYEDEFEVKDSGGSPSVNRDFYLKIKEYLLSKVDAPMESMEVRRRAVEALGHISFIPEIRKIVLRFYHEAPNPFVRVSALYAMGLVKNAVFEKLILENLYSDNDTVLLEAIHSCASLELQAAEDRLVELTRSVNTDICYESIISLGSLASLNRLPGILDEIEAAGNRSDDMMEALQSARALLQQRQMLNKGEPIWDDNALFDEIQEMLDPDDEGDRED